MGCTSVFVKIVVITPGNNYLEANEVQCCTVLPWREVSTCWQRVKLAKWNAKILKKLFVWWNKREDLWTRFLWWINAEKIYKNSMYSKKHLWKLHLVGEIFRASFCKTNVSVFVCFCCCSLFCAKLQVSILLASFKQSAVQLKFWMFAGYEGEQ